MWNGLAFHNVDGKVKRSVNGWSKIAKKDLRLNSFFILFFFSKFKMSALFSLSIFGSANSKAVAVHSCF